MEKSESMSLSVYGSKSAAIVRSMFRSQEHTELLPGEDSKAEFVPVSSTLTAVEVCVSYPCVCRFHSNCVAYSFASDQTAARTATTSRIGPGEKASGDIQLGV